MVKQKLLGLILLISVQLAAQDSTGSLTVSGYSEAYYQYDFNKPPDNNRPGFIYSHNRHNEFNLNLGFVKANYTAERVRANLALATGTYMNANYTAEPGVLKNIFEANLGIRISKTKQLWIDAGILPSHIGFESAVGKDCWNLTRSMLADNSPYFEAGAKISYTTGNGKWIFSGLALNGWQRIKRVDGNSLMSWGTQIQFKPSPGVLLNYSTFIGTDKPDSTRLSRSFHNLYGIFNITEHLGLTVGFDIGTEEAMPGSDDKFTWYSPIIIARYAFNGNWAIAGRVEHYNDEKVVIIETGSPNGFQTTGYSLNIDHSPFKNLLVRVEARILRSRDDIFIRPTGATDKTTFITSSIGVAF